jgi:DNA mismatch endonuclease Vsr
MTSIDFKDAKRRKPRRQPMTRSENMSRIRSKNTGPEWIVRRALWAAGLRYRLHVRSLPGCPDIVFMQRRTAIQIRGCFWHRHPGCAAARIPSTRRDWWSAKLAGNVARDAKVDAAMKAAGWRVLVVWECETSQLGRIAALVADLKQTPGGVVLPL